MAKKCNICGKEAKFAVKDTSDFYCEACAEEQFGELSLLVKVEDQAAKLKKAIEDRAKQGEDDDDCCENDNDESNSCCSCSNSSDNEDCKDDDCCNCNNDETEAKPDK